MSLDDVVSANGAWNHAVTTAGKTMKHQLVCPRVWLTAGLAAAPEYVEKINSVPILGNMVRGFLWVHEQTIDRVSGLYAYHIEQLYGTLGLHHGWQEAATHITADAIAVYAALYTATAVSRRIFSVDTPLVPNASSVKETD